VQVAEILLELPVVRSNRLSLEVNVTPVQLISGTKPISYPNFHQKNDARTRRGQRPNKV
jgi:hypothetical protein